jgi:hypothetical protein
VEQKNIQEADKRHEGWMLLLLLLVVEGRFCFSVDDGEEAKRQTTSKTTLPPWVFKKKRGENKPLRLLRKPLFSVHCKMANVPLSQEWVEFSKALELGCERGAPGVTIEDAEKFRGPKKPRVFFFSFFLCAFGLSMARRARLLQVIS